MSVQMQPIPVPPHQRGEIGYNVYAERVASFQAHNLQQAPAPHAFDTHAPWQGPGIDVAIPVRPSPAPVHGYVPSPLYKDADERPAKKVAIDPQAKKDEPPKAVTPEAKALDPQRGFVTVTTTTYPVYMQHPAAQPVNVVPLQGAPVFRPFPAPVFIAQPAPAPKQEPVKAPVETPVAKQAPAPVVDQRPQALFNQAYGYEREIYREKVRVHQAPVIVAPAPAAAPRPQVVFQSTHTHHRYSVLHSWSPVVAFALTVIFTGFMVSLAAPIAAPILFPTAVMIATGSLFLKAAMHRRC